MNVKITSMSLQAMQKLRRNHFVSNFDINSIPPTLFSNKASFVSCKIK